MFSQTTEYALRAMACLAVATDRFVPTTALAGKTLVPGTYLAKVLQDLATARLIVGRRGVGGGYRLARRADQITILEVVAQVGIVRCPYLCPLGRTSEGISTCALHGVLDEAAEAVARVLDGVSLWGLVGTEEGLRRPLCVGGNGHHHDQTT